ncbi:YciI family protein [Dactylosporangium sp. AC04546]|uniref:YciI family protein n=1 Tax=Dactylosporangium sp. AC04546 TaxID=2862460 RepID=UPI001EDDDD44|nr:YciI family protein [Dactylosporangium sp. AC04546]WVK88991.1 YciI family protein [Dactylosporangium sp. AC04546]
MLVLFLCFDRPGDGARRRAARAEHLRYMMAHQDALVFGGPIADEPGGPSVGSVFVLDLPDLGAADRFLAAEPYHRAGVFESVLVRPFRQMMPEPVAGHLQAELDNELAGATG